MNLSKNFTLAELSLSQTAARRGIDNTPPPVIVMHLRRLCVELLQPIRDGIGNSISVSSGYRSERVNKMIGGSSTSAHKYGYAADITASGLGDAKQLAEAIVKLLKDKNLDFDQVILEFGEWVHVAIANKEGMQRGQVLTAVIREGKTKYLQGIV